MAKYLLRFSTHLKNQKKMSSSFVIRQEPKGILTKKKWSLHLQGFSKVETERFPGFSGTRIFFARPCLHPVGHAKYPTTCRLLKLQKSWNKCLKPKASQLFQVEVAVDVCCNLNSFHCFIEIDFGSKFILLFYFCFTWPSFEFPGQKEIDFLWWNPRLDLRFRSWDMMIPVRGW